MLFNRRSLVPVFALAGLLAACSDDAAREGEHGLSTADSVVLPADTTPATATPAVVDSILEIEGR